MQEFNNSGIANDEANQSGAKDSDLNEDAGGLKDEVENISKESQTGYQNREGQHFRNASFLSLPNSCSSIIELEDASFNQAEEKSPDLVIDLKREDVGYRMEMVSPQSKPRISAIVPARTANAESFIQYTMCDASTDFEKSPGDQQQEAEPAEGKNLLNSIFSHMAV